MVAVYSLKHLTNYVSFIIAHCGHGIPGVNHNGVFEVMNDSPHWSPFKEHMAAVINPNQAWGGGVTNYVEGHRQAPPYLPSFVDHVEF